MGMIIEKVLPRLKKNRAAAQLIEEALLLSVALVALSLLVGGVDTVLKQAGSFTSNIWSSISSSLNDLFSSAFHW
jgi:Flp pilus assembly pilin Flp